MSISETNTGQENGVTIEPIIPGVWSASPVAL